MTNERRRNASGQIARFMAGTLVLLAVLAAFPALLLFDTDQVLLSPATYKSALEEQHLYERLPALAAEEIAIAVSRSGTGAGPAPEVPREGGSSGPQGGPSVATFPLTQGDLETIFAALLPADWLRAQIDSVIDQAFAMLDASDPAPSVTISLTELKARLGGQAGLDAALRVMKSWPACTDEQLRSIAGAASPPTDLPRCRLPDEVLALVTPEIATMLGGLAARIGDEVDLTTILTGRAERQQGPRDSPLAVVRQVRRIARLAPAVPLVLLLLATALAVRSRQSLLRWWGVPLLLVGFGGLGLSMLLVTLTDAIVPNLLAGTPTPDLAPGILEAGLALVHSVARPFGLELGAQSAVMGLLGIAFLAASFRLATRPSGRAQPRNSSGTSPSGLNA